MKKIIIITNSANAATRSVLTETENVLRRHGISFVVADRRGLDEKSDEIKALAAELDCAIAIGGDGTTLAAARFFIGKEIPIFGINTGHLGYLSATESQDAIDNLEKLVAGEYTIEERATLLVNSPTGKYYALNEAVFHRGEQPHLIKARLSINGHETDVVRGDGVLVATPTGSTAYNLSAGGPIIAPTAQIMVATPICAHSLTARPIVLDKQDEIKIEICPDGSDASLAVDGKNVGTICAGQAVYITLSDKKLSLIRTSEKSFFKTLQKKLSDK